MRSVDVRNFAEARAELRDALARSAFVCIDCEFTGLGREQQQGKTALRSPNERYQQLRATLRGRSVDGGPRRQGFLVVQVGLACFAWDAKRQKYAVESFSFFLSPRPLARKGTGNVKVEHDLHFGCTASALAFLSQHGFDFNTWLNHGVPFMSRSAYQAEVRKVHGRSIPSEVTVTLLAELEEARGFLDVWEDLVASGRPLVGHQSLLDLLYLWQQLEGPLPPSLTHYVEELSRKIPLTIDTKHLLAAYPEHLAAVLSREAATLQEQFAGRQGGELVLLKESRCKEVLHLLEEGALKSLQLMDLYVLFEPLVREVLPAAPELQAHDAGTDAYITGTVFLALHVLINRTAAPPSPEFIRQHHSLPEGNATPPLLGSPEAFQYANRLHVFASPFSFNTQQKVLPVAVTHRSVMVVKPPRGGAIDPSRIQQILSSINPHGDLHWISFQKTAVVFLHATEENDVTDFIKAASSCGWTVMSALDFRRRRNGAKPSAKRRLRRRGKLTGKQKAWLEWVKGRLDDTRESDAAMHELTKQLAQSRQQSSDRLAELLSVKEKLSGVTRDVEALREEKGRWASDSEALSALRNSEQGLKESTHSLQAGREALERERDELMRGMETYRKQAESLRTEVAGGVRKILELEQQLSSAESRSEMLTASLQDAKAAAARQINQLRGKLATKQERRAAISAAAGSGGSGVGGGGGGGTPSVVSGAPLRVPPPSHKRDERDDEASAQATSAQPNPVGAAPGSAASGSAQSRGSGTAASTAASAPQPETGRGGVVTVEEVKNDLWQIEHARGSQGGFIAIEIRVDPKKPQTIEIKECHFAKIFVFGTVGSVTFTSCDNIQLYCAELLSSESSKRSLGWGDRGMHGPKVFFYSSDKGSIRLTPSKPDTWPERARSLVFFSKKAMSSLSDETQKVQSVQELSRLLLLGVVFAYLLNGIANQRFQDVGDRAGTVPPELSFVDVGASQRSLPQTIPPQRSVSAGGG